MTKENIATKVKEMIAAPSCCADLKAAGQAWLYELGKDGEEHAAKNLIAEIEEDITPIDGLVAFAHSENAVKIFGEEGAKKFAAHADELKAGGAKYCDCGACKPALEILQNKEVILN